MSQSSDPESTPDIRVTNNEAAHQYEAHIGEELVGLTTYRRSENQVVFTHAEVYPKWEGQGVGSVLAREALDDVISQGLGITPRCPFIANFVSRNPSYLRHVEESHRQEIEAMIAVGPDDEVA